MGFAIASDWSAHLARKSRASLLWLSKIRSYAKKQKTHLPTIPWRRVENFSARI
jgi:hypothetical protein